MRRYSFIIATTLVVSAAGCWGEPTKPSLRIPPVADSLFGVGETRWFLVDTLGGGTMVPAIDAERVYVVRGEFKIADELVALDRATGTLLWHRSAIPGIGNAAALAGETVGAAWPALLMFNRRTGAAL